MCKRIQTPAKQVVKEDIKGKEGISSRNQFQTIPHTRNYVFSVEKQNSRTRKD